MGTVSDHLPGLEVALAGEGITPEEVSIRHLSEILAATSSLLDAVADSADLPGVHPALREVRSGSAALLITSREPQWGDVIVRAYEAIRTRGRGQPARVRAALGKLFRSAKIGNIRVGAQNLDGAGSLDPIHMAAPLEAEPPRSRYGTTIYGRIVGVNVYAGRVAIKVEHVDGGREEFDAEPSLAERAAKLFNRHVRAIVELEWDGDAKAPISMRDLQPWSDVDFVNTLLDVRAELQRQGVTFDLDKALEEID